MNQIIEIFALTACFLLIASIPVGVIWLLKTLTKIMEQLEGEE